MLGSRAAGTKKASVKPLAKPVARRGAANKPVGNAPAARKIPILSSDARKTR
jgi:hypothetical protein